MRIAPEIPWNPQRGDPKTWKFGVDDWAQCMSNSFQNLLVWIGLKHRIPGLDNMTTYAYTSGLESRLRYKGEVFGSDAHLDFGRLVIDNAGLPYHLRPDDDPTPNTLATHIRTHGRPIVFGIDFPRNGRRFRHICTAVGATSGALLVEDPYGDLRDWYRTTDGHLREYSFRLLDGRLTRAIFLEDK